jgi:hypothetical protein
MSREQRLQAAEALFADERLDKPSRLQALAPWMVAQGLRLQFIDSLSRARRASLLANSGLPEETAAQVLLSFHLVARRPLLARFLDLLGVKHKDGLVEEDQDMRPDPAKLPEAIAVMRREFPAEDVDVYFRTLVAADPEGWGALAKEIAPPTS